MIRLCVLLYTFASVALIVLKVSEIVIPPTWLVSYPTIFQPLRSGLEGSLKSVILSKVENVTLTEVVLTAKHEEAYLAASIYGAAFENWFFETQVIIRDGEDVFIPPSVFSTRESSIQPPSSFFRYTVSLALPHKQGIAQRGSTRFIVISSEESSEVSRQMDSRIRSENLEINESFLISAVLSSAEPLSQANNGGKDSKCCFLIHIDIIELLGAVFSVKVMQSPIDADLDHVTVYIGVSYLRQLGVLDGDWVSFFVLLTRVSTLIPSRKKVLASPIDSSTSRLVRIGALVGASNDLCGRSALLSPMLLHNICPRGHQQVFLRMSPYGTRDPCVPTARSIELARVASPFSIHRCYEPLLVDALHEYFGSSKRLVKGGDIIPLQIDIDRSLSPRRALSPGDFEGSIAHNCSDVLVYFVVRNVVYESATAQGHGQPCQILHGGCFVDSNVTRIIQVGVEHTRVPDTYDYYGLGLVSFRPSLLCLLLTYPLSSCTGRAASGHCHLSPDLSTIKCLVA